MESFEGIAKREMEQFWEEYGDVLGKDGLVIEGKQELKPLWLAYLVIEFGVGFMVGYGLEMMFPEE